jgi:chromate transporter
LIETTHRQPRLTAPLTGITAAVVGVILNLAVFFAVHVLWPAGAGGGFEWAAALIALACAIALIRFNVPVMPLIAAAALAGLLLSAI